MALKYTHRPGGSACCPQCKEAISRQANLCPHCRTDLSTDEEWQAQKAKSSGGCAMLVILGMVCTSLAGISLHLLIG